MGARKQKVCRAKTASLQEDIAYRQSRATHCIVPVRLRNSSPVYVAPLAFRRTSCGTRLQAAQSQLDLHIFFISASITVADVEDSTRSSSIPEHFRPEWLQNNVSKALMWYRPFRRQSELLLPCRRTARKVYRTIPKLPRPLAGVQVDAEVNELSLGFFTSQFFASRYYSTYLHSAA